MNIDEFTAEEVEEKLVERGMPRSDAHSWAEYWHLIQARPQFYRFFAEEKRVD